MVRGTLNINTKFERLQLLKSTLRLSPLHVQNAESFHLELQNHFEVLEICMLHELYEPSQ